jgi:hypothetical protein
VNERRDIKLIREAQSKQGAGNWISKHGYGDLLYVDDRDIDGDNIPDIVVRQRVDNAPYIVKGYTTDDSGYPLRHQYYTEYPTREERRGHSMKEWFDENAISEHADQGLRRVYKPEYVALYERDKALGYKMPKPRETVSIAQAFKQYIMKPIMKYLKLYLRERNVILTPEAVRKAEQVFRNTVLTVPVLEEIYGTDQISGIDDNNVISKLSSRKEVKDGCIIILQKIIKDRGSYAGNIISALIRVFDGIGAIPNGINLNELHEYTYNALVNGDGEFTQQIV